jgi:LysM repeat protein
MFMNERLKIKTSGNGGSANTWILIFLIVIAVHLVVILGIGGFKLLNGDKEISKDKEAVPAKDLKIPKEDYLLNLPPEKNTDLEEVLNSLNKIQTSAEPDDKEDEAPLPQLNSKAPASQSKTPEPKLASETPAIASSAAEPLAKPIKTAILPETSDNSYIVIEGDTLRKIAAKTGVSVDVIRKKNRLDKDVVRLGQKLIIPGKSNDKAPVSTANMQNNLKQPVNANGASSKPSVPSAGEYKTYQVGKGDTLSKIATLFHTSPEKLSKMNNIGDPRKLKMGMELKIPKE